MFLDKNSDIKKDNSVPKKRAWVVVVSFVLLTLIICSLVFGFYLSYYTSLRDREVKELENSVQELKTELKNLETQTPLQSEIKPGSKAYTGIKFGYSLNYPDDYSYKYDFIESARCGTETLKADGSGTGKYEGECEELMFSKNGKIVLNMVVSNTSKASTNFSYMEPPLSYEAIKENYSIKINNSSVSRYKLVSGEKTIGYSYNIPNTNSIEVEDFTGDINIGNLYFGAYTQNIDAETIEAVEMILTSINVSGN